MTDIWTRSLRFHLSVVVVALLTATSAILIGSHYHEGRRAALAAARQQMRLFSDRIVDRYRTVFGSAAVVIDVASGSQIVRRPEPEDEASVGQFLQRLLRSSEYVDGAYVGYPTGAFVHAVNIKNNPKWRAALSAPDEAAFATRIVAIDDQGQRSSRWEFLDGEGHFVAATDPDSANYDPRERSWYESAVKQSSLIWNGPYRMFTTEQMGITIARRHAAYQTIVFGADVLLGTIDTFLATQLITPSSTVFVFDSSSRLIASSDEAAAAEARCAPNCSPLQGTSRLFVERAKAAIAGAEQDGNGTSAISVNGSDYLLDVSSIVATPLLEGGHVVSIAPISDLTYESDRLLNRGLMLSTAILVIGVLCAFLAARQMSHALGSITAQAEGLTRFEFGAVGPVRSRIVEIAKLGTAMSAARETIATFGLYVPKELVRRIIGAHEFTGRSGARQTVTALFSDIMDFTAICEQHSAEDVVSMLSDYFDLFGEAVQRHGGVIIQFSGDSIFALWNAPQQDELHIDRACLCALDLKSRIADFNTSQKRRNAPELITRFGLHTGGVVVGSVGARDRFQYTAIGDAVNVASRLEGLNKEFNTTILVSSAVVIGAGANFHFRSLGLVAVKGREEQVEAFELCGARETNDALDSANVATR
jgi:adenylate cyclase